MTYTIKIGGNECDFFDSLQFTNTLDLNVNDASIAFSSSNLLPSAYRSNPVALAFQDVQILRDNVLKWRGIASGYKWNYDREKGRKYLTIPCKSNKIYLDREAFRKGGATEYVYGGFLSQTTTPGTNQASTLATKIFNDILACQYSSILTQGTVGATSIPHAALYVVRNTAMSVLQQLVAASLWEARFNPNNTVDFQKQVGSTTSIYTFDEGRNMETTEDDYTNDALINDVILCGTGSRYPNSSNGNASLTGGQVYQEVPTGTPAIWASEGRWSKIYNFSNVADSNLLTAYANAVYNDLQGIIHEYSVDAIVMEKGVPFNMGDVVTVNNPELNIVDQNWRVVSENVRYDAQQHEDYKVGFSSVFRQVNAAHFKRMALEYILNSQWQNDQAFANGYNSQASISTTPTKIYFPISSGSPNAFSYAVLGLSGLYNGSMSFNLIGQASGTSASLKEFVLYDYTNSTQLAATTSFGGANPYTWTGTISTDILDHWIYFEVEAQGGASPQGSVNSGSYMNFTSAVTPPS